MAQEVEGAGRIGPDNFGNSAVDREGSLQLEGTG